MNKAIRLIESYMEQNKTKYLWLKVGDFYDLIDKSNGRTIHASGSRFEVLKLTEILIGDGYIVDDSIVRRNEKAA